MSALLSKSGKTRALLTAFAGSALLTTAAFAGPNDSVWTRLFNPKDTSLSTNWDIHIRGEALNSDSRRTFRRAIVGSDTVIEVNYDQYTGSWGGDAGPFGHMGYKLRAFSYYLLRGEYQVWGTQATGGPSWAFQNNGFMLHSQPVNTMTLNQDFPISLEAQLYGPGQGSSTMNLCTPGTGFSTTPTGTVSSTHCVNAKNTTRAALNTGWQKVSALVLGDSVIKFMAGADGMDSVYQFYKPVYLSGNVSNPPSGVPANNTRLTGGYITIQSETHPFRFRRIDVLNLEGCMRPTTDANYKSYLVKHDSTACAGTSGIRGTSPQEARFASPMTFIGNAVKVGGAGMVTLELFDIRGTLVGRHAAQAPFQWTPSVKQAGMHVLRAITPKGTYTEKATLF
jgi:hypothetical protein